MGVGVGGVEREDAPRDGGPALGADEVQQEVGARDALRLELRDEVEDVVGVEGDGAVERARGAAGVGLGGEDAGAEVVRLRGVLGGGRAGRGVEVGV